jgi:ribosome-binding protein aMBF1 (putative translation factor)
VTTGERVKQARAAAGVTQVELAWLIRVAPSTLCDLEKGRHRWTVERLREVARVLNVELTELL